AHATSGAGKAYGMRVVAATTLSSAPTGAGTTPLAALSSDESAPGGQSALCMTLPDIATRDEWLAARTALLAKEKELTRARDALNAERRRLPMVEVTEDYRFEGPVGKVGL